jgi:hypothetical protein
LFLFYFQVTGKVACIIGGASVAFTVSGCEAALFGAFAGDFLNPLIQFHVFRFSHWQLSKRNILGVDKIIGALNTAAAPDVCGKCLLIIEQLFFYFYDWLAGSQRAVVSAIH